MHKFLHQLFLSSAKLAGLCIVSIVLLILLQVISRQFQVIIPSIEEFSGYLLVAASFLGLAHTFTTNRHVRVSLLIEQLSMRTRLVLDVFTLSIALVICAFLSCSFLELVWDSWTFNDVSSGYYPIPEWVPQSVMAFGALTFNLAVFQRWWRYSNKLFVLCRQLLQREQG